MLLRTMREDDESAVLALNDRHEHLTAPLDRERLRWLATIGRVDVLDVEGAFAGFVVTMDAGSGHDSDNFAWYAERYPRFGYLDRVVVHEGHRRRGLASAAYDEVGSWAAYAPLLALEVNLDPPNEASLAFHRGRGFRQVGEREYRGHTVAMLVQDLELG